MSDDKILEELLLEIKHMVIAVTLEDGTPWAVPVHIQHQDGKTFEWYSLPETVHSEAISKNPMIGLTIFSADTDLGFYAKAHAEELPDSRTESGRARYRATVTEAWINEQHTKRPLGIQ